MTSIGCEKAYVKKNYALECIGNLENIEAVTCLFNEEIRCQIAGVLKILAPLKIDSEEYNCIGCVYNKEP